MNDGINELSNHENEEMINNGLNNVDVDETADEEIDSHDNEERIRLTNKIYKDWLISVAVFRECQSMDPFCNQIIRDIDNKPTFFFEARNPLQDRKNK